MKFPERLKQAMRDHDVRCTELAKEIGVAQSTITSYRKGRTEPSFDLLLVIARYFDVSLDWLLGND